MAMRKNGHKIMDNLNRPPPGATYLDTEQAFHAMLLEQIAQAQQERKLFAVLLVSLDNFAQIAQLFSFTQQKEIAEQICKQLLSQLRSVDYVYQLGITEYGIVLSGLHNDNQGMLGAHKVLRTLQIPYNHNQCRYQFRASIGVSFYPSFGAQNFEELIQQASIAKQEAQQSFNKPIMIYQEQYRQQLIAKQQLEAQLRHALEYNELSIFLQPQYHFASQTIQSAEGLLRWTTHEGINISPTEIIAVAEQSTLIHELTHWVIHSALRQCAQCLDQELTIAIAINLSAHDLLDPELMQVLTQALNIWRIPENQVILEITESAMMRNPEECKQILKQLKAMGVRLAIDDFGTGYSSLAYLNQLPLDELKIDKSFVQDVAHNTGNRRIVHAIMDLAHHFDLEVVAEGVEDEATMTFLKEIGCDKVQGYYVCKPIPFPRFLEFCR